MAWALHEQGVSNTRIAKQLGKHRKTIGLWVGGIKEQGLEGFLNHYEQAKKGPRKARQIDLVVKRLVWQIREREHDCCDQRECPWCGQKITYFLKEEHDIKLSVPKIYEILAEKYQIRSKWKKNQKRGAVPEAAHAREVVQVADATSSKMDSVMFGGIYAFTAVDTFSREADVLLAPALTASEGYRFLQQSMSRRFDGHVRLIQTDGGPEFKEDFKTHVLDYCERHRIARPYKKNEQGYIESFNRIPKDRAERTFRKECLGWGKYDTEAIEELIPIVEGFLDRYHYHRPHLAFEPMRPPLTRTDTADRPILDLPKSA